MAEEGYRRLFSPKGPQADVTTEQDAGVAKPLEQKVPRVRGGVCEINPKLGVQMAIRAWEIAQGLPTQPHQEGNALNWNHHVWSLDIQAALCITSQAFRGGLKIQGLGLGIGDGPFDPYDAACQVQRVYHLVRQVATETYDRLKRLGLIIEAS